MAPLKWLFSFYRLIFQLNLVDLTKPSQRSKCITRVGHVVRWATNVVIAFGTLLTSFQLYAGYRRYVNEDTVPPDRHTHIFYHLRIYEPLCVPPWLAATLYLRVQTQRLNLDKVLGAILKLTDVENYSYRKYWYLCMLLLAIQSYFCFVNVAEFVSAFSRLTNLGVLVGVTLLDFLFEFNRYFLAHSCLFFSVLMLALTDILRPPPPPYTPRTHRKYIELYEEVHGLAMEVNRMFSPLLLLTYAISVLGASAILLMGLIQDSDVYTMAGKYYSALINVAASVICIECIVRCNSQRGNYLKDFHLEISKRTDKRLLLPQLEWNTWMMELLLNDEEEWFDVGCCVSVDESTALTVFQMVYDTTMGLQKIIPLY